MYRFYCPFADKTCKTVEITDSREIHHLLNVLRLKRGSAVSIFNGRGLVCQGKIASINKDHVEIKIMSRVIEQNATTSLILACALPKKQKFESIIEKATELGVDEIIPMETRRTEIKLRGQRLDKKIIRYRNVALNAAKQSKRKTLPVIHSVTKFNTALEQLKGVTARFIPSLSGNNKNILQALLSIPNPPQAAFLIGPEGDFTPQEYKLAAEYRFLPVSLGETILKVDTAAIVSIASAVLCYK